jgi:hypothetical protein
MNKWILVKKSMVTGLIALSLMGAVSVGLLTTGCATTGGTGVTIDPVKAAASVKIATQFGVYWAVKDHPEITPYIKSVQVAIQAALDKGNYSPEELDKILNDVNMPEQQRPLVRMACASAIEIYRLFFADVVDANLDQSVYVRPVLQALSEGILLGLDQPATAKKYNLPR